MTITNRTRTFLRELVVGSNHDSIWRLFSYYEDHGEEAPTQKEIGADTGLNPKTIKAGTECLAELNFVSIDKVQKNRRRVRVQNIASLDLDDAISLLLGKYLRRYSRGESTSDDQTTKDDPTHFSAADILRDEDWKTAQPVLERFFGKSLADPRFLSRKNYFSRLCQLLSDSSIGFENYCRWYHENKFKSKGFNYGLFLCDPMIQEYRDRQVERNDDYLRTSSTLQDNEVFEREVAKSNEWLANLGEEDTGA